MSAACPACLGPSSGFPIPPGAGLEPPCSPHCTPFPGRLGPAPTARLRANAACCHPSICPAPPRHGQAGVSLLLDFLLVASYCLSPLLHFFVWVLKNTEVNMIVQSTIFLKRESQFSPWRAFIFLVSVPLTSTEVPYGWTHYVLLPWTG